MTFRPTFRLVAFLLLFSELVVPLYAQQSSGSVGTLRTETLYVQVPISVSDRQGHLVHGLAKGDFVIKEDGKVQKIASFEHIEHVVKSSIQLKVPDGVYTNRVEQNQPARLTIIAIDAVSTAITERLEVRKQILDFISRNVSTDQPVALVIMGENRVKVLHDFTTDPHLLIAAVKNIVSGYSTASSINSDNVVVQLRPSPLATGLNVTFEQMARAESDTILTAFQGFITGQRRSMVRNSLLAFNELAEAFAGIPGRKSLIWITNGESVNTGDLEVAAAMNSQPSLGNRNLMTLADAGVQTDEYFKRTWRLLNDSNMAVYPLDVSDISNPGFTNPAAMHRGPMRRPLSEVTKLEQFAEATGGTVCLRNHDLDNCLKQANEESQDYYLAGYYAAPSGNKETWRAIQVSTTRNDLRVRARTGYFVRPLSNNVQVAHKEILGAMGSPLEYTSLPLEVKLDGEETLPGDPEKQRFKFVIFVPPTADFISDTDNSMDLSFAIIAKQSDGKPVAEFVRDAAGALKPMAVADLSTHGFVLPGFLDLPVGTYELRCVVRDNHNGHLGSLNIPVKVEAAK